MSNIRAIEFILPLIDGKFEVFANKFEGKVVVITGASGLIGLHLLAFFKFLREKDVSVRVITSFFSNPLELGWSWIEEVRVDLSNYGEARDFFFQKCRGADYVWHCAGYGQPLKFSQQPLSTIAINTIPLLACFEALPKAQMIFVSSSELYSGSSCMPHSEAQMGNTNPQHSRSAYIEGKRCGEAIVEGIRSLGGDAKSVRLALAFGPGVKLNDQRVLNQLVIKANAENRVALLDSGSAIRTYIPGADAIFMFLKVLTEGKQSVYNVGGTHRTSILELAKLVCDISGSSLVVPENDNEALTDAPIAVELDTTRYINEFGVYDSSGVMETMHQLRNWYRYLLEENK